MIQDATPVVPAMSPRHCVLPLNTGAAPVPPRAPWWIEATANRAFKIVQLQMMNLDDWWVHAFTIDGKNALQNESQTGFPASNLYLHGNTLIAITDVAKDAVVRLQVSYIGQQPEGIPFLGMLLGLEQQPDA